MDMYLDLNKIIYRFGKEGIKGDEGVRMAYNIMAIGAATVHLLSESDHEHLYALAHTVFRWKQAEHWDSDLDPLLSCCYHLLAQRRITRTQAAEIARKELKYPPAKEWPDTWRIRVDRWARDKKRNLPPVQVARGGARTKQTNK